MPVRSTPSLAAIRRATGDAPPPSGEESCAAGRGAGVAGSEDAGAEAADAPAPSALIRAITWPTVTVSPSSNRISAIVPLAGAGSSISTLSVEISTTVSPSLTVSPTFTDLSRIVPSVTDSPPVGVTMSTSSPLAASVAAEPWASVTEPAMACSGVAGSASPGGFESWSACTPPFVEISASTAPTVTVSPSAAWILTSVPATGAGTSASTLSVEISTRGSSAATLSPSCLCHSRTVPSDTESPIAGITTWIVLVPTAIRTSTVLRAAGPGRCFPGASAALCDHKPDRSGERSQPAQHDHRHREPERNDVPPGGGYAHQRHTDPHQAVGQPQDERCRLGVAQHERAQEQAKVDAGEGERRQLQPAEGERAHDEDRSAP